MRIRRMAMRSKMCIRDSPQGDPVHPLKEGDAPTGLADEDAALTEAGDDVGRVWGGLEIAADQQQDAQKEHNACDDVTNVIHVRTS